MANAAAGPRFLVKAKPGAPGAALAVDGASVRFDARPLFESIAVHDAFGMAAPTAWQVLTATEAVDLNPWDACHRLLSEGLGVAGGEAVAFAEPDLAQQWPVGDEKAAGFRLAAGCGAPDRQKPDFPTDPDPYWIRNERHGQFDRANDKVGAPTPAGRVRIAHFDTGYDPAHRTLPRRLNRNLQRNFVDAERPNDACEVSFGALSNPGHGTGTLGILAGAAPGPGRPLGCAPEAEVVPLRVADSVVLFYNSAIARAFDYVHGLAAKPATRVDIITMSMGGLASQAWADAVNALYEQGVFIVTAAGNNFANLPTRHIVYPARFHRVVAACGIMANHRPYADLAPNQMAGNYGPDSKMETAVSAFTPNTPWARMGCPGIVDLDGAGTSSATPQVAAAAALWLQANRAAVAGYPQGWMRVEAIRQALFRSASGEAGDRRRLGRGELRALAALGIAPPKAATLVKQPPDSARFPFLDTLLGTDFGIASDAERRMLELEALQLSQSAAVEAVLPDAAVPPDKLTTRDRRNLADALIAQPGISAKLSRALQAAGLATRSSIAVAAPPSKVKTYQLDRAMNPPVATPNRRRLKVFALDPSLGTSLDTAAINEAVLDIRWETNLKPGPVGDYVEVIDIDPSSRAAYAPVDLNHPHLLPRDGLTPAEDNPQFHQQMVYAVAMRTIEFFEHALGRSALWAPRHTRDQAGRRRDTYVQRLRIYPHAIRAANAFYSPDRKALLLGYFAADHRAAGEGLPGGMTFSALSHDVIAHETTHALLDGLHRRFREPTNPDVLAFHEAFADIVALFQHFSMPEALRDTIRTTRGDLGKENLLGKLAVEFGQAIGGGYGALRDAIGSLDPRTGAWVPAKPARTDYDPAKEAHALGSVLVSAVFAAFLAIYKARTRDLVRLATNGSGVLPEGDLPEALAGRLAEEASKVAGQVLSMTIRALDYCPPVDITFGDYLRALITADRDLVPDDPRGYRAAFVAAFRDRGIYPTGVRHLSPGNLVWEPPPLPLANLAVVLKRLKLTWSLTGDRREAFDTARDNAAIVHSWLTSASQVSDDELAALGLRRKAEAVTINGLKGRRGGIEVHSVRPARRIGPDGQSRTDLVVEITQTFRSEQAGVIYRGGCTLLIDLEANEVRYFIRKRLDSQASIERQTRYRQAVAADESNAYSDSAAASREPFALLHRHR
ncbi:S8 family serine peptidase [Phreatobacter stygius]|uniref:Peptidase S8 n=1 Tax=Phreatobacter stygius TaxID=1940610 RepID=A0A4D7B8E2_9HYPH|nr:S8 family serine peptidase [Phreatobacter stygius]QCI66700.1 peptidase S8 [Phreatobacter stygius]